MPGAPEAIRLLELTRVVPGAFCTMIRAGMGAEVIKVEMPPDRYTKGGSGSGLSPQPGEKGVAVFSHTNRNKKSVAIDLNRKMQIEIDHPELGKVTPVGAAIKTSDTPGNVRSFGPFLGQHTDATLDEPGYDFEHMTELRQKGVVARRLAYCQAHAAGRRGTSLTSESHGPYLAPSLPAAVE